MSTRSLSISAINIKMPVPHSAERYISLLRDVFQQRRSIRLGGDRVALLGSFRFDASPNLVFGEFYKYMDLDASGEWFNLESGQPAEEEDLEQIVIPDNLKPHFQFLPYVFFPRTHRLFYISKDGKETLSPAYAKKTLEGLFASELVTRQYGQIEVTVEPSFESLESILSMPQLKYLEIDVTPPNPGDDLDEEEQRLFEEQQVLFQQMSDQRASRYRVLLNTDHAQGLSPDLRTRRLATIAQSNGKVVGKGGPHGRTKTVSTTQHPLVERTTFDSELQVRTDALLDRASAIMARMLSR